MISKEEYIRRRSAGESAEKILGKEGGAKAGGVLGTAAKVGSFLGMEEFGRGLAGVGARAMGFTKGIDESLARNDEIANNLVSKIKENKAKGLDTSRLQKSLEQLQGSKESALAEREAIETGGVTGTQVLASAGQTLASIIPAAKIGKGVKGLVASGAVGGGISGGLEGVKQGTGLIPGAIAGSVVGGTLGGALGIIANRISALGKKLPDTLMTRFLGQSKRDLIEETTRKTVQRGEEGATEVVEKAGKMPDLSKQALARGLRGNEMEVIDEGTVKLIELEEQIQKIVQENKDVVIKTDDVLDGLDDLIRREKNVLGEAGVEVIENYKKTFRAVHGDFIDLPSALQLKRDIYKKLGEASYHKETLPIPKESLKRIGSALVKRMAESVDDLDKLNKEQQFWIRTLDSLESKIVARSKQQAFGLSDVILAGGGIMTGNAPVGVALAGIQRLSKSGRVQTNVAVALDRIARGIDGAPSLFADGISKTTKIPKETVLKVLRGLPAEFTDKILKGISIDQAADGGIL